MNTARQLFAGAGSALLVIALVFALSLSVGCSVPMKLPAGSAVSFTHVGNYGPFQTRITATAVDKRDDGSFRVGHYDGTATWLGFGPHDVVEGLVIDPTTAAKALAAPVPLKP